MAIRIEMEEITRASNRAKGMLAIILLSIILAVINILSLGSLDTWRFNADFATGENHREPRLGDGCLNVYLDVGANIGVHTRFLFEPDKYPRADTAKRIFNEQFGISRDNRDLCSFGFEPNPSHKSRHQNLEKAYQDVGWRYKHIFAGASDRNGTLRFWHQGDAGKEEWGFSMAKLGDDSVAEDVPLIHLSKWIQHHIVERQLPEKPYGEYPWASTGKVVMKMDIEASEYIVLPSLLFSGVFCKAIDFAFGEDHAGFSNQVSRTPIDNTTGQGELFFESTTDAKNWYHQMQKMLKSMNPEDCKGRWVHTDDESHLHDGAPYPTKP